MGPAPESVAFPGNARFALRRWLGSGGFGIVYEALDRQSGNIVALKTLHGAAHSALLRLKQEFRALADLVHPNLVNLYELHSEDGHWFFTMELVDGCDLIASVRQGLSRVSGDSAETRTATFEHPPEPDSEPVDRLPPPDFARLRSTFAQVAEGVSALHASGMLHGDLKPPNILVSRAGRVVILDFGLARSLDRPAPEDGPTEVAGTPAYMAPEQGLPGALTAAADWYAFGAVLYEAITGNRPSLREGRVAPGELVPETPVDLNELTQALLRPRPAERAGAEAVMRVFGGTHSRAAASSTFVGRAAHLAALESAYAAAPAVIALRGASGMGKTELVRRFLAAVRSRDRSAVVLAGRCYESESVPYKAVDSLVDAVAEFLRLTSTAEASALLPRDIHPLARLFPVLRSVDAVAAAPQPQWETQDSQEVRRRAFAALKELLARLAARRPLILAIDDLHWGDLDSGTLLADLFRKPDAPAALLVATYRAEEEASSPLLRMLLPAWSTHAPLYRVLDVKELDPAEAQTLAAALARETGDPSVSATTIAREAGGSPLFIAQLNRYRQTHDPAAIAGSGQVRLDDVIRARVAALDRDARRLLEVLAVAAQPVPAALLWRAAALDAENPAALRLLRTERLLRTVGGNQVETYHDRIRSTVAQDLAPPDSSRYHLMLGHTLENFGASPDPATLAVHFEHGGDLGRSARHTLAAAQKAVEALAFDRAARLYRKALTLPETPGVSRRLLHEKLGIVLAHAGRGIDAAEAFLELAATGDPAQRIDLQRRAAEQYLLSGRVAEGRRILEQVLASVGGRLARTKRGALLSLLYRRALVRLRGTRYTERPESAIAAEELLRIDAWGSAFVGLAIIDSIRASDAQARQLLLALRAGEPSRIAKALAFEAANVAFEGTPSQARAQARLNQAMELAQRIGDPHSLALACSMQGMLHFFVGQWRPAINAWNRARQYVSQTKSGADAITAWEFTLDRFSYMTSRLFLGEYAEVRSALRGMLRDAAERGDAYASTSLRCRVSQFLHLVADEPAACREEVESIRALWVNPGYHVHQYWLLLGQTEADLYAGDYEQAWSRLRTGYPDLRRSMLLRFQLIALEFQLLRARTAVGRALTGVDPERMLRNAIQDAERVQRTGALWAIPQAHLVLAAAAAIRGEDHRAAEHLERADQTAEAAGMLAHAAAARYLRGRLLGDTALVEAAESWLSGEGVRNPARFARLLAPGHWRR